MMRKRSAQCAAILILLVTLAPQSRAWNATGHMAAAQIAWRDLSPAAREKCLGLLKEHPHFAKYLTPADIAADAPEYGQRVFALASIWPDQLRSARGKDHEFHHSEWHYVNFPIIKEGTDPNTLQIPPVGEKLDPEKGPQNVLQALAWNAAQLKREDLPAADRAVALAWVLHLVGDIHQPLHAAAFFSSDYPAGDKGGNLFMVKSHGSVTNLHSLWDNQLGGYQAPKLVEAVTNKTIEKHPRAALEKELKVTGFSDWAAESLKLSREVVYADGKLKGATRDQSLNDAAATPDLPEGYEQSAKETAELRVALAGYRLGDFLNSVFK